MKNSSGSSELFILHVLFYAVCKAFLWKPKEKGKEEKYYEAETSLQTGK